MSNKKKTVKKPAQKKREIGVSYTDREGRRRYVYRSDFLHRRHTKQKSQAGDTGLEGTG